MEGDPKWIWCWREDWTIVFELWWTSYRKGGFVVFSGKPWVEQAQSSTMSLRWAWFLRYRTIKPKIEILPQMWCAFFSAPFFFERQFYWKYKNPSLFTAHLLHISPFRPIFLFRVLNYPVQWTHLFILFVFQKMWPITIPPPWHFLHFDAIQPVALLTPIKPPTRF